MKKPPILFAVCTLAASPLMAQYQAPGVIYPQPVSPPVQYAARLRSCDHVPTETATFAKSMASQGYTAQPDGSFVKVTPLPTMTYSTPIYQYGIGSLPGSVNVSPVYSAPVLCRARNHSGSMSPASASRTTRFPIRREVPPGLQRSWQLRSQPLHRDTQVLMGRTTAPGQLRRSRGLG